LLKDKSSKGGQGGQTDRGRETNRETSSGGTGGSGMDRLRRDGGSQDTNRDKDRERAIEDMNQAILLDPSNAQYRNRRALLYRVKPIN
jgi:hypothetical protein